MDKLPKEYLADLKEGYYKKVDGEDCLKPEFIVKYPKEIAKGLKDRNKNKLSQIWKFYEHARRIQDTLQGNLEHKRMPFAKLKAELDMMQPIVESALNRSLVTPVFKDFIDENVSKVEEIEDLDAFIKHFQALIAYLPRENQK